MGYFQVRYDSRVVNCDHRGFIRLATENTHYVGGRITVRFVWSLTGLDSTEQEHMLLFVYGKAAESKLLKSQTVVLPLTK